LRNGKYPHVNIIRIDTPGDPRIAGFRDIRERDLTGRQGRFVAEGDVVLRQLVSEASRCRPIALLLAESRVPALSDVVSALPRDVPIFVACQAVLDEIAGFHLHRGILALGEKPQAASLPDLLSALPERALVLLVCGVGNHDNVGGIFRNAAAFGADAVLLDKHSCDPFYRKAIRVSVGAVLRMPMVLGLQASEAVTILQDTGFTVLAMTGSAELSLEQIHPTRRMAIVLGAEGPGLPPDLIARCIPTAIRMANGFDSLNVATAGAIALNHCARAR
jgi:tRNA G18 (ribose-2'-O)-methylase SpoU